jgi:thioredoxin-like negative regulator of GroEL
VIFIKVDVDKCKAVARAQKISAMPTFKFFKHNTVYHMFSGASAQMIEKAIQTYVPAEAEPNPNVKSSGGGGSGCVVM